MRIPIDLSVWVLFPTNIYVQCLMIWAMLNQSVHLQNDIWYDLCFTSVIIFSSSFFLQFIDPSQGCGTWFSGLSAYEMWGDRDTAREPPLGPPEGQEPALAESRGSKLPSWRGLEKKGLWAAVLAGLQKPKFRIPFWLAVKGGKIH